MKLIIALVATFGLATIANAADLKGTAGNYGSAGCGLGSLAFGKTNRWHPSYRRCFEWHWRANFRYHFRYF